MEFTIKIRPWRILKWGLLVVIICFVLSVLAFFVYGWFSCSMKDRLEKECTQGKWRFPATVSFVGYELDAVETVHFTQVLGGGKAAQTLRVPTIATGHFDDRLDLRDSTLQLAYCTSESDLSTEFDLLMRLGTGETHYLSDFRTTFHWNQSVPGCICVCMIDSFKVDGRWVKSNASNVLAFTLLNPDTANWARR